MITQSFDQGSNERRPALNYVYDALNRRMSKKTDKEKIRYLYVGQNEIGSVDSLGNIVELRVLGQDKGAEIGAAIALELHGKVFVPIHDHQGNCVAILDKDTGQNVESYRYSAFGLKQLFDGDGNISDESINPLRFSSKRYEPKQALSTLAKILSPQSQPLNYP